MCLMKNCTSLMIYVRKCGSLRIWRPPKKSVPAPKVRAMPAPKHAGQLTQGGTNPAAKRAPHSIASSSSAHATHSVTVMQTEHVQQFKVCSRTRKLYTVPLDGMQGPQQHWYCSNDIGTAMQKSVHCYSVCLHHWRVPHVALKYPCNPPPPAPGRPSLGDPPPPVLGDLCVLRGGGGFQRGEEGRRFRAEG